ncbi:DUF420 domain-containing protein [soil metagenome]
MSITDLPLINASLNALTTVFILAGWWFISRNRIPQHITCMVAAIITSGVFLSCYLYYHLNTHILTRFGGPASLKPLYLAILIPHIILAFAVPPLVIMAVIPALRQRFDRHRRIVRWTLPIWLYVSVTGVLVYLMLYQWFTPIKS